MQHADLGADYTVERLEPAKPNGKAPRRRLGLMSAADLMDKDLPPIRYIVPGYIAEGCTLLAGRPKLGKSWLVLEMGLAVAMGGVCLGGIACEQGAVLYLALEDNQPRLQKRVDKVLGAYNQWPESLRFATGWPRSNEGGVDQIRQWIVEVENPRLIIVDVLAMLLIWLG